MIWPLQDRKGLTLVKYVSSCMYERRCSAGKSHAWTQGMCILERNGLGVYFFSDVQMSLKSNRIPIVFGILLTI